ncbi:hypothetical protein MC885_011860 [Smutsia gigantea]|nr:hypothetical protein MC885_011860 [Smutsia gigantea]
MLVMSSCTLGLLGVRQPLAPQKLALPKSPAPSDRHQKALPVSPTCLLLFSLAASLAHMAHVFVYGTLKTGQPNHKVLLDGANGRAAFRGQGRTLEPHPLVIAGEHNIPWLLDLPGRGLRVLGEIYAVDEQMLRFLDEFEGCPDMYQRTRVQIAVLEWEGARSAPEGTPVADGTLQCFVYSTATYSPEL